MASICMAKRFQSARLRLPNFRGRFWDCHNETWSGLGTSSSRWASDEYCAKPRPAKKTFRDEKARKKGEGGRNKFCARSQKGGSWVGKKGFQQPLTTSLEQFPCPPLAKRLSANILSCTDFWCGSNGNLWREIGMLMTRMMLIFSC